MVEVRCAECGEQLEYDDNVWTDKQSEELKISVYPHLCDDGL